MNNCPRCRLPKVDYLTPKVTFHSGSRVIGEYVLCAACRAATIDLFDSINREQQTSLLDRIHDFVYAPPS